MAECVDYLKSVSLAHEFNTFLAIAGEMRNVQSELHHNLFFGKYGKQERDEVQYMITYLHCVMNGQLDDMRSMEEENVRNGQPRHVVTAYSSTPLLIAQHQMKFWQRRDAEWVRRTTMYSSVR